MTAETLLAAFERRALESPHQTFAKIPIDNTYTNEPRDVSFQQVITAARYIAALLQAQFGRSQNFESLAYIGPSDLRYTFVVLAGIQSGFKVFLPSPRNSIDAHVSLLEQMSCSKLITTMPGPPCIPEIKSHLQMHELVIPSLDELLSLKPDSNSTSTTTTSSTAAPTDPIFVLHTSGSTGTPKPLTFTNEYVSRVLNAQRLASPPGYESIDAYTRSGRFYVTLPPFHMAGLAYSCIIPAFSDSIPIYPVSGGPPTLQGFLQALQNMPMEWAILPPAILDDLAKKPDILDMVSKKLKYVFFTGGSMPRSSGTAVASCMKMLQIIGSSEVGSLPLLRSLSPQPGIEDWHYVQIHPAANAIFEQRSGPDHELVIVRHHDKANASTQPVFSHFDVPIYSTKDLFIQHPTSTQLWSYVGRLDDIIVFLNGEKTNPITFEDEVASHPDVRAALVIGQQRFEAGLLVEVSNSNDLTDASRKAYVDMIWPLVKDANTRCPKHAKVSKSMILIADPKKPFLRAGKGTVQRSATLKLYADEIDSLYSEDADPYAMGQERQDHVMSLDEVKSIVADLVQEQCGSVEIEPTTDLFTIGIDSLQVIKLRKSLRKSFPSYELTTSMIYSHPSITALSECIIDLADGTRSNKSVAKDMVAQTILTYQSEVDALLNKNDLSGDLARVIMNQNRDGAARHTKEHLAAQLPHDVVLLTGSTGSIGAHVLHTLLSTATSKIYCLNRSFDSQSVQCHRNKLRGLPTQFDPERVVFLTGDPAMPQFGLDSAQFLQLEGSVTHVIHSAWPVDFNKSLRSFQRSLDGLLGLIAFSSRSRCEQGCHLVFLSSISSVAGYTKTKLVPEVVIHDPGTSGDMGYGQSKHIAEVILDYASKQLGIRTSSVRIGQVAGDASRGCGWNKHEWFPSLVTSSRYLNMLPDNLGFDSVDWIPIDELASILVKLTLSAETDRRSQMWHLVHPTPQPWTTILNTVKATLEDYSPSQRRGTIRIVPFSDWISALKDSVSGRAADDGDVLVKNPALKLLDFFEAIGTSDRFSAKLDLDHTLEACPELKHLPPIEMDCLRGWIKDWIA